MFNIGFSELIVVLLIAFLVVGPKDLPKVARWLGRMVKRLRQMILEVKRETGWDEFESEIKDTKADVNRTVQGLRKDLDVTRDLKDTADEWNRSVKGVTQDLHQAEQELNRAGQEIKAETMNK